MPAVSCPYLQLDSKLLGTELFEGAVSFTLGEELLISASRCWPRAAHGAQP